MSDPTITVICDVCNHPVHALCNGADCEKGECWRNGDDFDDRE